MGTPLAPRQGAALSAFAVACFFRRGVAGRVDRPAEEGRAGRTASEAREEPSSPLMSFLLIYRVLARNGRTGVVLEHLRLSTLILNALRFEGNGSLETGEEGRVIGEFDVDLGAIAAILIEVAGPDHFAGEFFALNHGDSGVYRQYPNAMYLREQVYISPNSAVRGRSERSQNITLIVCRLIVVKRQALGSA